MPLSTSPDTVWLFTGDSITDYGHHRDPDGWGYGYVRIIAQWLNSRTSTPGNTVPKIINRATSGNTILNLQERWEEDVLDTAPDVVSIKIGTNDVWAGLGTKHPERAVLIEKFVEVYDGLLTQLRDRHPLCQIVLCEPCGIWPPAAAQGNVCLLPYFAAIRELAVRHRAYAHVALHQMFQDAIDRYPDIDFLPTACIPARRGTW